MTANAAARCTFPATDRRAESATGDAENRLIKLSAEQYWLCPRSQTIKTTDEHPFWSHDQARYVLASELALGAEVVGPNEEIQTLTASNREEFGRGNLVYNFRVSEYHTYYVSEEVDATPLLVHNAKYSRNDVASSSNGPAPINKNSRAYQGESHVYVIKAPDGTVVKVGKSSVGKRVGDGASRRAESQVRKLNREDVANGGSGGYSSEIRKDGLPTSGDALDYEHRWRTTYRRLFGQGTLPGNREH